MVQETSFLGMRLRTRIQRRVLVTVYYAVLLAVTIAGLLQPGHGRVVNLLQITFWMALMLGGIYGRGPVKAYTKPLLPSDMGGDISLWDRPSEELQTLELSGSKADGSGTGRSGWEPLDEREQTERDHAHYVAYRILRWTMGATVIAYWASLYWVSPSLNAKLPLLTCVLLIYVLSLPQSVVLWTEPDMDLA